MKEFEQIYSERKRKTIFKKNIKAIKEALKALDPEVLELNSQLIEETAMYACNLSEINEIITRDGVVDTYRNSEFQWGTKKSVAAELKPKYTATYQSLIKQLSALLPTEGEKDAAEELMEFINNR